METVNSAIHSADSLHLSISQMALVLVPVLLLSNKIIKTAYFSAIFLVQQILQISTTTMALALAPVLLLG